MTIRHAQPSDYGRVIGRVTTWWEGRERAPQLPQIFFLHFEGTSFVADDEDGQLAGFLIGFLSQTAEDEAFVHFVGVAPERRRSGVGQALYARFLEAARDSGRSVVRCVAHPSDARAISFHESVGFTAEHIARDFEGLGEDRVILVRTI
jgi:ribosomal protein S18 acetylase RimI-like enzyme